MRIAVVGAGALGSLVAGLLALGADDDTEIWLVGLDSASAHFAAITVQGLRLELSHSVREKLPAFGKSIIAKGLHLTRHPEEAFPCDLAIVLVKSDSTASAAHTVSQLLAPQGLAVSLQNGLGNAQILAQELGDERVIAGTTLLGATMLAPGQVLFAGLNNTILAAPPTLPDVTRTYLKELAKLLESAGAPVILTTEAQGVIWGKLLVNCAINPVAALLDITNGELLQYEAGMQLMADVVAEVVEVAKAAGIKLPFPDHEALERAKQAAKLTAANYCSMVQDLRRGRPTEIEALNGAVVREAERVGVSVPVNRTLTNLIRLRQTLHK